MTISSGPFCTGSSVAETNCGCRSPLALLSHQMRGACDEVQVFSTGRHSRAEIPTDAARRHHCDFHRHVTALP
jgi:hypothetical protein